MKRINRSGVAHQARQPKTLPSTSPSVTIALVALPLNLKYTMIARRSNPFSCTQPHLSCLPFVPISQHLPQPLDKTGQRRSALVAMTTWQQFAPRIYSLLFPTSCSRHILTVFRLPPHLLRLTSLSLNPICCLLD